MALQRCGTKVLSWNVAGDVFLSLVSNVEDMKPGMTDFFHVGEMILKPHLTDDLNDFMSASAAHMTVTNTWMNTLTELEFPTIPVVWFNTALCEDVDKTFVQKLWMLEQMDCGRAALVQDDMRARMKEDESLVDLFAPMTSTMASTVHSLVAPLDVSSVASMAPLVASMASVASMEEALVWLKRVTAESKSDDERVDGLFDGLVQAVTWARMKRAESLVDSKALRTLIALTMTMMVASMMATMVAPRASGVLERIGFEGTSWLNTRRFSGGIRWLDDGSPETQQRSRSKEEITPRGDRDGIKKRCQNGRRCHDPTVALTVNLMMEDSMVASMALMASRASVVASMASVVELLEWLKRRAAEPQRYDERVNGLAHSDELTLKN